MESIGQGSMTEQHHQFRDHKKLGWEVKRLIELARDFPVFDLHISEISEIDTVYWFDSQYQPTCRAVVEHTQRIHDADLSRPVILSEQGLVMDGMHRICKAILEGLETIKAVQFLKDPEPDSVELV